MKGLEDPGDRFGVHPMAGVIDDHPLPKLSTIVDVIDRDRDGRGTCRSRNGILQNIAKGLMQSVLVGPDRLQVRSRFDSHLVIDAVEVNPQVIKGASNQFDQVHVEAFKGDSARRSCEPPRSSAAGH